MADLIQARALAGDAAGVTTALQAFLATTPTAAQAAEVIAEVIPKRAAPGGPLTEAVLQAMHGLLADRTESLPMALLLVKEALASALEARGAFRDAVTLLQAMTNRRVPDAVLMQATVRLAEIYLMAGEPTLAEGELVRCASYVRYDGAPALKCRYTCCMAQVYEAKRRFTEAALRYLEVSARDEQQRKEALCMAAVCAVMGEPSESRGRVLAALVADERIMIIGAPLFGVLRKAEQLRILRPADAQVLTEFLSAEHKTGDADDKSGGLTVLSAAILTHNVKAVSRSFDNIGLEELATLLDTSYAATHDTVVRMVTEGRLAATIDQVQGAVSFTRGGSEAAMRRDTQIAAICADVTAAGEVIALRYPALAAF